MFTHTHTYLSIVEKNQQVPPAYLRAPLLHQRPRARPGPPPLRAHAPPPEAAARAAGEEKKYRG